LVPARQAHSHCASVGKVTFLPVFFESHRQNSIALCQETRITGNCMSFM
jgi:hypothetical protein